MVDTDCSFYEWIFDNILKSSRGIDACLAKPKDENNLEIKAENYCECDFNGENYRHCRKYQEKTRGLDVE